MAFTNIEIKARTQRPDKIRNYLQSNGARFMGIDNQTDTYFLVPSGRLKLRQGNIENSLIYYNRNNDDGPKKSDFSLVDVPDGNLLKEILDKSLGILTVVKKQREIYFIDNVKFHIDTLPSLGDFIEIEASNKYKSLSLVELKAQCDYYIRQFALKESDFINVSYSDMLLAGGVNYL